MTTLDALPHWHDEPDVYDALFLAGQRIPGVVTVDISRKVKIDKKSPKGKHKGTITKQGLEPAELSIEIQVLDPADVETLRGQMNLLEPVPDTDKATADDALDITHWTTAWRGIEAIVVEDLKGPELVNGILVLKLKALEFDKPKPATTGTGTGTGTFGGALKIGTFVDPAGDLFSESRIAVEAGPAIGPDNQPIQGVNGEKIFLWSLMALGNDTEQGFSLATGGFYGRYLSPDEPLRVAWEKHRQAAAGTKDATSTPKKSAGAPDLGKEFGDATDAPDPATTDTGP